MLQGWVLLWSQCQEPPKYQQALSYKQKSTVKGWVMREDTRQNSYRNTSHSSTLCRLPHRLSCCSGLGNTSGLFLLQVSGLAVWGLTLRLPLSLFHFESGLSLNFSFPRAQTLAPPFHFLVPLFSVNCTFYFSWPHLLLSL